MLVLVTFTSVTLFYYLVLITRSILALSWRETHGDILSLNIQESDNDINSGPTFTPLIEYKYSVENEHFTSQVLGYGLWGTTFLSLSERTLGKVCNNPLLVYYNPENPGISTLVRGFTLHHAVCLLLVGSTFAISCYLYTIGL